MTRVIITAVLLCLPLSAAAAASGAADAEPVLVAEAVLAAEPVRAAEPVLAAGTARTTTTVVTAGSVVTVEPIVAGRARTSQTLERPKLLLALYSSYAGLQAFDIYTTRRVVTNGREANPLMRKITGNTGVFMAVKVGATAASIIATERLWKTNKAAAIATMIVANGVAAIVASHNARAMRRLN